MKPEWKLITMENHLYYLNHSIQHMKRLHYTLNIDRTRKSRFITAVLRHSIVDLLTRYELKNEKIENARGGI
jgi:hypothetical protein